METARQLTCEYSTIRKWMLDTFECRYGCPWHGWDRLERERQAALEARFKLVEAGNVDPVAHNEAMLAAVQQGPTEPQDSYSRRVRAVDAIVRSNLEIISHFELLYAKVFQQATGLSLDHAGIHGLPVGDRHQQLRALYDCATLKTNNMDSAVKTMIMLRDTIARLQADLGLKKLSGYQPDVTTKVEEVEEEAPQELTIEELRKFREMLEHTPADKVDILKKLMRSDDASVKAILGEPAQKESVSVEPVNVPHPEPELEVLSAAPPEAFVLPPPPPPIVESAVS